MGELTSRLKVDLSELRAQLQTLDERQSTQERRTARVIDQVRISERQLSKMEQVAGRLENKLTGMAKNFFKAGIASVAGSALDALNVESTEGKFLTNVISATATGAAFGGAPGAAFGALAATVTGLVSAVREINTKMTQALVRQQELKNEIELEALRAQGAEERAEAAFEKQMAAMREEMDRETEDLIWESGQYVGE